MKFEEKLYHWILPGDGPDMHLAEIWRYPIKSMVGEMLPEALQSPAKGKSLSRIRL
jgi:hypothetical protein